MINWILQIKANWKLKRAIKKADKAREFTGRKHYVIMDEKARLIILNREMLKEYNRKAKKRLKSYELSDVCLYQTPNGTTKKRK